MKKIASKKLHLSAETVRTLDARELEGVQGAGLAQDIKVVLGKAAAACSMGCIDDSGNDANAVAGVRG